MRHAQETTLCFLGLLAAAACWVVFAGCAAQEAPEGDLPAVDPIMNAEDDVPAGFTVFRNDRFDFTVAYPDSLLSPLGESADPRSQLFVSADSSVLLTVFGREFVPQGPVAEIYRQRIRSRQNDPGLVFFSAQDDSSFVVSGTSEDQIYYEKTIFFRGTLARFELTYPIQMQAEMDSIVTYVSDSFTAPIR